MNKHMDLYDHHNIKDKYQSWAKDTLVEVFLEGTDRCIFRGKNKCVIAGSGLMARKMFSVGNNEVSPSYNESLSLQMPADASPNFDGNITAVLDALDRAVSQGSLDADTRDSFIESLNQAANRVYLFAVGTDGCGTDAGSVYNVPYISRISPASIVPFQFRSSNNDLSDDDRTKYFGKRIYEESDGSRYYAYYFKAFDNAPLFKQQYTDGSPITEKLYDSIEKYSTAGPSYGAGVVETGETWVKLQLSISSGTNHPDCREWFTHNGSSINSSNARINTISLVSAYPVIGTDPDSGRKFTYYKDIRPVTKLNIPNESLIDVSKGLIINYYIFL